jgi:hypothetical protein
MRKPVGWAMSAGLELADAFGLGPLDVDSLNVGTSRALTRDIDHLFDGRPESLEVTFDGPVGQVHRGSANTTQLSSAPNRVAIEDSLDAAVCDDARVNN